MPVGSASDAAERGIELRLVQAARVLQGGGIVAYPTEGVFGVGCLPTDTDAIEHLLHIKRRSWRKGLPLIAADLEQLAPFVTLPEDGLRAEILASWPGPVTWVLPARPGLPAQLTGGRATVAVRIPGHASARALCLQTGSALISTSANRSGRKPLLSAREVRRALGAELDFVLAGPLGDLEGPTAIRDGLSGDYLRGG